MDIVSGEWPLKLLPYEYCSILCRRRRRLPLFQRSHLLPRVSPRFLPTLFCPLRLRLRFKHLRAEGVAVRSRLHCRTLQRPCHRRHQQKLLPLLRLPQVLSGVMMDSVTLLQWFGCWLVLLGLYSLWCRWCLLKEWKIFHTVKERMYSISIWSGKI